MNAADRKALKQEILKNLKQFENEAFVIARKDFEEKKAQMVREFYEHPVTQEIQAGPEAQNTTNTLGGNGNLYSYIGFDQEEADPIEIVGSTLEKEPQILKDSSYTVTKNGAVFEFKTTSVDQSALERATPLPFEDGKSWLRGIEKGISGLSNYIYSKSRMMESSRSGTGVQTENKIRSTSYKAVKYVSDILAKFNKSIK